MLNIPEYRNYSGETKIALMDNSTVAFLEQVERAGISAKELLIGYEVILIPNWISEEICDSIYRKNFIESLVAEGLPIYFIAEENYTDLANGEEGNLYKIVFAAVSTLAAMRSYLHRHVEKSDSLDMEEYAIWLSKMYQNWPLSIITTKNGREKKKNAGEISLTILAEVFSWYYPNIESITMYTQDRDSYDYQTNARNYLRDAFKNKVSVDVSYKSNDFLLCKMYRKGMITLNQVNDLRNDERVVVYTNNREDKSVALATKKTNNQEFIKLLQDANVQIIF